MAKFHTTISQPSDNLEYGGATRGSATALGVEIPLMVLAFATVILRVYSRLAIKRNIAADDILIILGTVCLYPNTQTNCMIRFRNMLTSLRPLVLHAL
jgi:hypothetical protein